MNIHVDTYTHTMTDTKNIYLYIQRIYAETRSLQKQATPMGHSQTQILVSKKALVQ